MTESIFQTRSRVSQNLFHDNVPPEGTEIINPLALGEDIFIEVSHGPTIVDHNLLLSDCASRISTQGIAYIHNLIAGSFTWVGNGTDNNGCKFPTPRYTPYHMPHRTEAAGFMTILHGDARFYNNIFVQKKVRPDLKAYADANGMNGIGQFQFACGTKPYDGYPTAESYFQGFTPEAAMDFRSKDIYYDHLPVYTGGNMYFNGAQPFDKEKNYAEDTEHAVRIALTEKDGRYILETDVYEYLPESVNTVICTQMLGEAFEPEQKFEAPDGTPIIFNKDYFDDDHKTVPLAGPFASADAAGRPLFDSYILKE